jgi:hypothetical protein
MNATRVLVLLLGTALIGSAIACESDNSPTSPALMNQGSGMGAGSGTGLVTSVAPLDPAVRAAMDRAIDDEYHAEEIYLAVLEDFGDIIPFSNVVYAEARHSASIAGLYLNRGLTVPANDWNADNVPHFVSVAAACAAAVQAEEANINMYDEMLKLELPFDVERVFTNNRWASAQNHMPAFQLCPGS